MQNNRKWDLIVIGGGAAGLSAALSAAELGDRVLLLEAQDRLGKKILASGNGRCNLMNSGALKYYGHSGFAAQIFEKLSRNDLIDFWQRIGLSLASEGDRIYPGTFQSQSVLLALQTAISILNVTFRCASPVHRIEKMPSGFRVFSSSGQDDAIRLLIATGGAAQPKLGGNTNGYDLLRQFGHTIYPAFPALVPLITDKKPISGLAGIRIKCRISLALPDRSGHTEEGELLFTDYGISGICAMQLARFVMKPESIAEIHFLHRWFAKPDDMIPELVRRRKKFSAMTPEFLLNGFLLPKVSFAVCKQAGLSMRGELLSEITDDQLRAVAESACRYKITILGTKGFQDAQVTAGGANPEEFFPETLESKRCPGLHAAGEVLDVDGDCGGYNLMFAFAGGILAGRNGRVIPEKELVVS